MVKIDALEPRKLFSTYFINPATGSDAGSGRSPVLAWQTLTAVSNHTFKRGDKVHLTGTFVGQTLVLGANAAGVNSFTYNPKNRAIKTGVMNVAALTAVTGDGIDITTSSITIENLTISAAADALNSGEYSDGIHFKNSGTITLTNEIVNNVSVSGFADCGLCVQGWNTTAADSAGFSKVLIENSTFNSNQVSGIFAAAGDDTGIEFQPEFPDDLYLNSGLTIKNCQTNHNAGFNPALMAVADGDQVNGGNYTSGGIFLSSTNGAIVENSSAGNNGFASKGNVGKWAFDATHITFQDDESYDNKTTVAPDGDGFDFDHGVTNSIMRRDYSHGNDGTGFFITTNGGTSNNSGDIIQYCVSDDDGQFDGSPGIIVLGSLVPVLNAYVYNNTVLSGSTGDTLSAIEVLGENYPTATVDVFNNIFDAAGGVIVMDAVSLPAIRFEGNDYFRAGSPDDLTIDWAGTLYPTVGDWAAATGQETAAGKIVGQGQDPLLISETVSDLPKSDLDELSLSVKSPLRVEGLNLAIGKNFPYRLPASVLKGAGALNIFHRKMNGRAIGAG